MNDAIHMARNQMELTLVDTSDRVVEMAERVRRQCATSVTRGNTQNTFRDTGYGWDAVSCDTFTGDPMTRSLASLELWCSIAREVVTVTHTPGAPYEVPDGWSGFLFPRNDRVNWLVLVRD